MEEKMEEKSDTTETTKNTLNIGLLGLYNSWFDDWLILKKSTKMSKREQGVGLHYAITKLEELLIKEGVIKP